jgi:hypothetical protein
VRRGFSVNADATASQVARVDDKALRSSFDTPTFQVARTHEELVHKRRTGETRGRVELYPWLLLAVALAVAGENVLSSLFYRRSEP